MCIGYGVVCPGLRQLLTENQLTLSSRTEEVINHVSFSFLKFMLMLLHCTCPGNSMSVNVMADWA